MKLSNLIKMVDCINKHERLLNTELEKFGDDQYLLDSITAKISAIPAGIVISLPNITSLSREIVNDTKMILVARLGIVEIESELIEFVNEIEDKTDAESE